MIAPKSWNAITAEARWFPVGRPTDAKAPAYGYKTDDPAKWTPLASIKTPMAGLNFGRRDGLLAIDLDWKQQLAPNEDAIEDAIRRLRYVRENLPGPVELSHSGYGNHIFAWCAPDLLDWIGDRARVPIALVPGVAEYEGKRNTKACAAVEIFGGGNAYIAVTQQWLPSREILPDTPLPIVSLGMLQTALDDKWPAEQNGLAPPTDYRTTATFCGCPDWQYRPQNRPCKHQRSLAAPPVSETDSDRALRILRQCPVPADYDTWLRSISAAYNSGISLDAIEAWSATGTGYVVGEVLTKGGHLLKEPSIGWLMEYAKTCGVPVHRDRPTTRTGVSSPSSGPGPAPAVDWRILQDEHAPPEEVRFDTPTPAAPTALAELHPTAEESAWLARLPTPFAQCPLCGTQSVRCGRCQVCGLWTDSDPAIVC